MTAHEKSAVPLVGESSQVFDTKKKDRKCNPQHQFVLFTMTCCFWCFSCWQSEIKDRRMFVMMVKERKLRASAEFQLSYERTQKQRTQREDVQSVNESLPTTTETGRFFQDCIGLSDDFLQRMMQLGKSEHWLIRPEFVCNTGRQLGRGSFGVVVEGSLWDSPVALKTHTGTHLRPPEVNELRILRLVRHPNIVVWHGACVDVSARSVVLVFELIDGMTLETFILGATRQCPLPEPVGHSLILDIGRAVRYMHAQRPVIVHGDLKASNVMVEFVAHKCRAKLLDFGLSRVVTRSARPVGGTARWRAPELFVKEVAPKASCDVFSYGRLMYFIIVKKVPLAEFAPEDIEELERLGSPLECVWPADAPHHPAHVSRKCLAREPTLRPEMGEVLKMISVPSASPPPADPDVQAKPVVRLLRPDLRETPAESRCFMVIQLAQRWNVPHAQCCEYHSQLHVVLQECVKLVYSACRDDSIFPTCDQCQGCLALCAEDDSMCEVCGRSRDDGGPSDDP